MRQEHIGRHQDVQCQRAAQVCELVRRLAHLAMPMYGKLLGVPNRRMTPFYQCIGDSILSSRSTRPVRDCHKPSARCITSLHATAGARDASARVKRFR